jgi:DNA polymerase
MESSNAFLDFETRCKVPIQSGTDLYIRACEPIILSWAIDKRPAGVWDITQGRDMPAEIYDALSDERVALIAHSAVFDRLALKFGLHWETDVHRWRCTRAMAYAHGLPGSLDTLGTVLGLPTDQRKLTDDAKLIHTFCVPNGDRYIEPRDRPDDWERFVAYARRDTEALRAIYLRLPKNNYAGSNLECYWIDQLSNDRGFGLDTALAKACIGVLARAKGSSDAGISEATGGIVTAATQRARLLEFLRKLTGLDIPNMRAATIRDMLECDDLEPGARFLLQARLDGAKSASAKYKRGLKFIGPEDRIRHGIQFNGAGRTGRSTGKGFNALNMLRPAITVRKPNGRLEKFAIKAEYVDEVVIPGIYSDMVLKHPEVFGTPNEACGLALRHAIIAAKGLEFVVADYSNIESVKLAWLANETWKLELFRAKMRNPHDKTLDAYRTLYARFFGTPIEKVNDNQRQAGKVVELACGFGGGVGAVVTMAAGYNIDLDTLPALILPSADEATLKRAHKAWRRAFLRAEDYALDCDVYRACDVLKQKYRAANVAIDDMRRALGRAVLAAIKDHESYHEVARSKIWCNEGWLVIALPSGRRLLYADPHIEVEVDIDPETGKKTRYEFVTYLTARGKGWIRQKAWSGLFLENIVQASANDIERDGIRAVHADTLSVGPIADFLNTLDADERTSIILHVYDEIVVEVPIGSYSVERMIDKMCNSSPWAAGMPIMAAGWHGERYGKR